jgi:predicted nucleic acid-binding protein
VTFLLDTNVVSEWVKPRPDPRVVAWLSTANEDDVYLSVCTLAELRFGIACLPAGKRRNLLDNWLREELVARFDGRVVPIDPAIADAWGVLHARARATGRSVDTMDGLIAATAHVHRMTVVTRDVSAFTAAGLSPFNPWRSLESG